MPYAQNQKPQEHLSRSLQQAMAMLTESITTEERTEGCEMEPPVKI